VSESSDWPHGHSKTLTPQEHSQRASLAANISWAMTDDRVARTQPARDALFAKFCREVDPDGVLPEDERIKRAGYLHKAHMQKMSLAAAKARRLRKDQEMEEGLTAAITEIIATVPLSDETRQRITELMRGGAADEG
jgi:hypothetical protein